MYGFYEMQCANEILCIGFRFWKLPNAQIHFTFFPWSYLNTCFQHFGAWLPSSTPTARSASILKTCAAWSFMCPGEECDRLLFPSNPSPPQEAFANCARTSSQRVWIPSVQHRRAARRRPSRLRQIVSRSRLWSLLDSPPSITATPFVVPGNKAKREYRSP